jgi:glutaredoxin
MWLSFLRRWGRRPRLEHLAFVLYTRHGCHLCEDAWELLERVRRRDGIRLEVVDVDRDPQLTARYGLQVPVVTVNGKVRFRGPINAVLLERLLTAERRRQDRSSDR